MGRVDPVQAGWHKPKNPAPGSIASAAPAAAGPSGLQASPTSPKSPQQTTSPAKAAPAMPEGQATPWEVLPLHQKEEGQERGKKHKRILRKSGEGDLLSWTKWPKNRRRKSKENKWHPNLLLDM